jgi:adenosylhomocysteine nucleosidase
MLALLGAFGQEIIDLRRQMVIEEVVARRDCKLYRGKFKDRDALLVKTGMGKERAENATRFILNCYPVAAIISLGFAGALDPQLMIGDVVVCSTLYYANGLKQEAQKAEPCASDARLMSAALRGTDDRAIRFRPGSSVTVVQLDSDPRKMQELRETFHADIVEMESYWIARIAFSRQIPFIAIRSISDTMQQGIQPFDRILALDGRLLWKETVFCFLLHPWYLKNVFTLFRNTRRAKRNLTVFVSQLLSKI